MVRLNAVLECVLTVEEGIFRGESIRDSLLRWIHTENIKHPGHNRDFRDEVLELLRETETFDVPESINGLRAKRQNYFRRSFFALLRTGMASGSIGTELEMLRIEIENQLELDMKAHIESLPLKMLIPLLLFLFPAFLILLLGPITRNFLEVLR